MTMQTTVQRYDGSKISKLQPNFKKSYRKVEFGTCYFIPFDIPSLMRTKYSVLNRDCAATQKWRGWVAREERKLGSRGPTLEKSLETMT